jgi:hypothetical protein
VASLRPPLAPAVAPPPVLASADTPAVIDHRRGLGAELEVARGEALESAPRILEENHLAVGLTAELEAHGELGHGRYHRRIRTLAVDAPLEPWAPPMPIPPLPMVGNTT